MSSEEEEEYEPPPQRRRQTADERIYGVFTESDEDEGYGPKSRGSKSRGRADYTQPVAFVSGGTVQKEDDAEMKDAEEEDRYDRPGNAGLGSAPSSARPAFTPAYGQGQEDDDPWASMGRGGLGLGSGAAEARSDLATEEIPPRFGGAPRGKSAGPRSSTKPVISMTARDMGAFEVHTKGIGAKLLSKMGWQEGKGLGKEGKGISRPLEAQTRPKGMGMGFGNRTEPKLVRPDAVRIEEEEGGAPAADDAYASQKPRTQSAQRKAQAAWRRQDAARRERTAFRTAEDLLASKGGPSAPAALSIIDMRGASGPRVLTDLGELGHLEDRGPSSDEPLPELRHNLGLLVARREDAVRRTDARKRREQDSITLYSAELDRLGPELEHARETVRSLDHVRDVCELGERTSDVAALAELYGALLHEDGRAYAAHAVADIAAAQAAPLILRALAGWHPLLSSGEDGSERIGSAQLLASWKVLLSSNNSMRMSDNGYSNVASQHSQSSSDAWTRLLEQALLPPLRRDIINRWDPHDPDPLERFLHTWEPLLPSGLLHERVFLGLVLPRLESALEGWDPLTDPVPLHVWVHPWLPQLGTALEPKWPAVRQKFAVALRNWHPADGSALELLRPWARVWGQREWMALLRRAVAPRLVVAVASMRIDPTAQDLEPWDWVMAWRGVAPAGVLVDVLEQAFWPRWFEVLQFWLAGAPDAEEIGAWIQGWKTLLGDDLLAMPQIRSHLRQATEAVNAVVAGHPLLADLHGQATPAESEQQPPSLEEPTKTNLRFPTPKVTLRELVEEHAADVGVTFAPKLGRMHEGLQVFSYGAVTCTVDAKAGVIRSHFPGRGWVPLSVEALDAENQRRGRK